MPRLSRLGYKTEGDCLVVGPLDREATSIAWLDCGESGSTYRFWFPWSWRWGDRRSFTSRQGRCRPMDDLLRRLKPTAPELRAGAARMCLSQENFTGKYIIPATYPPNMSPASARAALLPRDSEIIITGKRESQGYITMTLGVPRSSRLI